MSSSSINQDMRHASAGENDVLTPSSAVQSAGPSNWQQRWRRLPLRLKIWLGFTSLIVLMAVAIGITLVEVQQINRAAGTVIDKRQPAVFSLLKLNEEINLAASHLNGYLLTAHLDHKAYFERLSQDLNAQLKDLRRQVERGDIEIQESTLLQIEAQFKMFNKYAGELFELRDDNLKNYPGLVKAAELLNPLALEYMALINDIIGYEETQPASTKRMQVLSILYDLRYSWVQMINSIRIFFNSRQQRDLQNVETYLQLNKEKLVALKSLDGEVGATVTFDGIGELESLANQYERNLPQVARIFQDEAWRADAYIMKNEVRPLVQYLRNLLQDIATRQVQASKADGERLTQNIRQIRAVTLGLLIGSVLLSGLIGWLIIRGLIPPIHRLMHAADRVAEGHLDTRVEVESQDEIGRLAEAFNTMVVDINASEKEKNQYLQEVLQLNRELEDRVNLRTRELQQSETRIRTILHTMGEGIITLDENGVIESVNPAAEHIFACDGRRLIGRQGIELLACNPQSTQATNGNPFATMPTGRPLEYMGQREDGSVFPMEALLSHMQLDNRILLVCVIRDITRRKEAQTRLADAQQKLVEAAHQSGMAEMATGVLHNIGNILNSVNLASDELNRLLKNSKLVGLQKANQLLQDNRDRLDEFLVHDEKGRVLPEYYIKLGQLLDEERSLFEDEVAALAEKIKMMKDVIRTQQQYARLGGFEETFDIRNVVDDAIKVNEASLYKHGVKIRKEYAEVPLCVGQRSKLLQVVTNLLKNAKEAMHDNDLYSKTSELSITIDMLDEQHILVSIRDNGCGIEAANKTRIFNHGFTTKVDGHGFGLHISANAMAEMRGTLQVESDGKDRGATFHLTIPRAENENHTGAGSAVA